MATWYCYVGGQRFGPISEEKLKLWIQERRVKPTDHVWTEGMSEAAQVVKVQALSGKAMADRDVPIEVLIGCGILVPLCLVWIILSVAEGGVLALLFPIFIVGPFLLIGIPILCQALARRSVQQPDGAERSVSGAEQESISLRVDVGDPKPGITMVCHKCGSPDIEPLSPGSIHGKCQQCGQTLWRPQGSDPFPVAANLVPKEAKPE